MISYIIKRSFYSFLVIVGVLLLTFVLFRLAAGDPARTLLGKKPSPKEVEELRQSLASDKPLFWGNWKKTEIFTSSDFHDDKIPKGIKIKGASKFKDDCLEIDGGKILFPKHFDEEKLRILCEVKYKGNLSINSATFSSDSWAKAVVQFGKTEQLPEVIELSGNFKVEEAVFSRYQRYPWDSQLTAAFTEIAWYSETPPYINFFNFGRTLVTREPVKKVLLRGIPPSLSLMLPIFFGELFLGIVLALVSTAYRDKWPDKMIMLFSIAGMSISYVVLLILGQWFLGYYFNWFPVWGYGSIKYLALPIFIGIISGLGGGVRFYRTIFVNELKKEYLRTAEAKGCSSFKIYFHHLLRNSAIPLITRASTILPFLFTGSLLLESFFGIPGLGYAGINALKNSDLQMVKALVILTALLFVLMNLLSDIAYAWADPRVRIK